MKLYYFLLFVIVFSISSFTQELLEGDNPNPEYMLAQDPTYANLPLPSEILVVYNANVNYSVEVASYYQQTRNIPSINLCPITDLPTYVNYGQEGGAYLVNRNQNGSYYSAGDGETIISWVPTPPSGKANWLYYKDYIETPIKNYIDANELSEVIKYIVLIKGLPYRIIRDPSNYSLRVSAAICALLSLMNQPDERDILTLYNTPRNHFLGFYTNPYLSVDYPPTIDYRFKSGHFVNAGGWYLNYLVSRLDGDTYDDVIDLIDRITSTDKSGEKKWILDDKPKDNNPNEMKYSTMPLAAERLDALGFNYIYDDKYNNITSDDDEVIGYSSHGYYAFWDSSYIWTQLQFDYVNGAIFNSWESKNALSYGKWHSDHGHLSDFIVMGGSGGGGNVDEPWTDGVYREEDTYPAYAMGYSIVDAIYQGIQYIAWQNDVIGDPLTTIAWGKQLFTDDLVWDGTNLVTGEVYVPYGNSLTINDDAIINLRHNGFITGDGELIIGENVTFNVNSWQRALFLSYDNFKYPRLVWGAHPESDNNVEYHIYRKLTDDGDWELLTQTTDLEYIDSEIELIGPLPTRPNSFYMVFAYLLESETPETPDTSNIVSTWTDKGQQKIAIKGSLDKELTYTLSQNYPNPFNPETRISYTIAENSFVTLKVFDLLGRELAELVNIEHEAGKYSVTFDASKLSSGIYFYTLQAGQFIETKKMTVMK